MSRGPAFPEPLPTPWPGPRAIVEKVTRAAGGQCILEGSLRVPPDHALWAVGVAFKCDDGREHEAAVHVLQDDPSDPELRGFPVRVASSSQQQVWCGDQRPSGPLHWRAELTPCCNRDFSSPTDWAVSLVPFISELVQLPPGCQAVRVGSETRPGILLTPGTIVTIPLPEGTGWQLEAGAAELAPGSTVGIAIKTNRGTTPLPSLSPADRAWHEHVMPLPALPPGSRLIVTAASNIEKPLGCIALGDLVVRKATPPTDWRPRVLLISLDTVRADHLQSWMDHRGGARFSRLSPAFVAFSHARANAPVTDASHLTIFSGQIAARFMAQEERKTLMPETMMPMAALLSAKGYRCAAFTDGGLVAATYGFHRGFDRYWEYPGSPKDKTHFPAILHQAWRWIAREDGQGPWCTFVHTYQAHTPYVDHDTPESSPVEVKVVARMAETTPVRTQVYIGDAQAPEETIIETAKRHYRSEVAYLDAHLTPFIEALEDSGFLDHTLVVVLSDHGEGFGEHGLFGHNNTIYEEQLDVPLMIRFPGGSYGGTRVDGHVQLADVFPTILAYLGLQTAAPVDGISLMPHIRNGSIPPPRAIISKQTWQTSICLWPHKLIVGRTGFPTRLFDLEHDPEERTDVIESARPEVVRALKAPLLDVLLQSTHGFALMVSRASTPSPPLEISGESTEGWTLYFTVARDELVFKEETWSMKAGPSTVGDVMILLPTLDGVVLTSGDRTLTEFAAGREYEIGSCRVRLVPCTGVARTAELPAPGLEAPDQQERLRALGYIQ